MSRFEAWLLHLSNLAVGVSGLLYAWMLYGMSADDPFSVLHHPLQPLVQHSHVWAAPFLVFAVGLSFKQHAWKHFTHGVRRRRRSGLGLLAGLVPMVVSGYLLQTAVSPGWRRGWVAVHLLTGAAWGLATVVHLLTPRRRQASFDGEGST